MRNGFILLLAIVALAVPATAQTDPLNTTTGGTAADQMLNDMLKPPLVQTPPATQPALSPIESQVHTLAPGQTLREGSDVVHRIGHIRKLVDQPYGQIVFDNSSGEVLPPMFVLPNLRLMQMEDAGASTDRQLQFTISGTVMEYAGNNYLLLDSEPPQIVDTYTPAAAKPTTQPASADQMLNDMLSSDAKPTASTEQRPAPAVDATSGAAAVAPNAPVVTVLREQTQIIDRIARMVNGSDNLHKELSFESDGRTLRDPPLIILPNLKLAAMEGVVSGSIHEPRFRVSGIVTEYRGRNYLLMEKVVVVPDTAVQF